MVKSVLKRWGKDISGNFSALFASSIMALLIGVGAAYDLSIAEKAKKRLQDTVDTAALAGASLARREPNKRYDAASSVLETNIALEPSYALSGVPNIDFDDGDREVTITASVRVNTAFMSAVGIKNLKISAKSTSGYAIEEMNPFAVMLVLDVSGSMSWNTSDGEVKLDALKTAVDEMFQALYSTSENPDLLLSTIRTGYASYESVLGETMKIKTGYFDTVAKVAQLNAMGGTNSTPAMQYAYDKLVEERDTQKNWSGYLVFMTDGDNNDPASDTDTLALCDVAKNDDITIFTVAFAAPAKGEALLQACANDLGNYYNSSNAQKLKDSFQDIGRAISQSVVRLKR